MNSPITNYINDQYERFKDDLTSNWGVTPRDLGECHNHLKATYKRFLSLACTCTIMGYRTKRNEYIYGVIEAGYLSIVLTLKGVENPQCVLLRQSIELVLKHIYFSNHPVEYEWARSREGFRDLTFQRLIEYLGNCEERKKLDPSNSMCELLNEWFGKLSRHVHVHSKYFIGYGSTATTLRRPNEAFVKLVERTKVIWPLLISLLIAFFPKKYLKASAIEKRLMINALSRDRKNEINRYLANYA